MALNIEQQEVINELTDNILLLASAGTGKTNTLALRVAEIIKKRKALPTEILCITFTNKACKEMTERISGIIGPDANKITIKTFHSFCFDIVKEQAKKRTDIFTDFVIFDEDDCKELIKPCVNEDYPLPALQQFIDFVKLERAKRNMYSSDISQDYENTLNTLYINNVERLNSICSDGGVLNLAFKEYLRTNGKNLILQYDNLLHENHGLDFSDLIVITKELFTDHEVVDLLRTRYKYINIDEVQDTSALEYEIIEKLFNENNILVCGDIFQTIYGWRGSEPEKIFSSFKVKYAPREIVFSKNYRATQNLTEASLYYLKNAFPKEISSLYNKGITAEATDIGAKISIKINDNIRDEARYIFETIKQLEENNSSLNSLCILTRDNKYNIELSSNLKEILAREAVSFDFVLVDQFKFFRRQEIKDIIAFLKLIANRYDALSLKRIVNRLPSGVGDKTLDAIDSQEYREVGITLSDYIDPIVKEGGEKYSVLINEFHKGNVIVFDVESTGVDVTEDEIVQIAAIKLDNTGKILSRFEKLLVNKKSVGSSQYVHGFTDERLQAEGEDKKTVLLEFLEYIKGSVIVGHNVQYDINILTSELSRHNLGAPTFNTFYDTLDIYRRFHPNLVNHKLDTLSTIYKTNHKPSHDAMDDIIATGELLVRALNEDIIPTSLQRIAFMSKHLKSFNWISSKLNSLFVKSATLRPADLVVSIINDFNIKSLYANEEGAAKISRLRDFYVLLKELDDTNKSNRDALLDIIKITGLSNGDLENLIINRSKKPRIPIITVHQAKGLEFETVFLAGAQNNTFPSYMSLKSNNLEEEKRTFYVAITRAKKSLIITSTKYNKYNRLNQESSFIKYIPRELLENK